jgi:iron complex transport system ATP-binding protein
MEELDLLPLATRPITALSTGERARVLLARAFAVEAPVLIADEPIAALDPYHQIHVMELLWQQSRNGTAVIAALHDLTLATRFCDRIVLLSEGKIVADGPSASTLTRENLANAYHVHALLNEFEGQRYIVPWSRQSL